MSSNWGFDYQEKASRERRERQQQTVEGQRNRRPSTPGLAPVSYAAAETEAHSTSERTLRSSTRAAVWALLFSAVAILSAMAFVGDVGEWRYQGWAPLFILGVLSSLFAVPLAIRSTQQLRGLARWTQHPIPFRTTALSTIAVVSALTVGGGGLMVLAVALWTA